jgi:L-lactate dehydrogenase complex protein LldG
MTSPRERILASLRDGLLRGRLPEHGGDLAGRTTETPTAPTLAQMADQFSAALTGLSGHVHRAAGAAAVAEIIAGLAREHRADTYIGWDDEHLGCAGLEAALAFRGLARVTYDVSGEPERRGTDVQALAGIGLGLTGAHAALADIGGLVLVSGPGRGRLASVLPPVHVAVVDERRLRPSLAVLLREEPRLLDAGSNVVIVAGPSRTADIEMTLTHGVHGPKHVHVILTA